MACRPGARSAGSFRRARYAGAARYWNRRSTISFADGIFSITRFDFSTFTANSMNSVDSLA